MLKTVNKKAINVKEKLVNIDREHNPYPRLVGGDKGCNVSIASFPGSPALWAGSFTLGL